MASTQYRIGLLFVTLSAIAWSTAALFQRVLIMDAWTMLCWRGLFGGIGGVIFAVLFERSRAVASYRSLGWPGYVLAGLTVVASMFFILSLQATTVAHVSVIYATIPFMAAALAWIFLREVPRMSAVVTSCIALAGVVVMVGLSREGSLWGDFLALCMTLASAFIMILVRRHPDIPVIPGASMAGFISFVIFWPIGDPLSVSGHDLFILFLFGVINLAAGFALFSLGAKYLPAVETALIGSLDAPLAPLWVWLVFGETPNLTTLVGGIVVLGAVTVHIIISASSSRPPEPPPVV